MRKKEKSPPIVVVMTPKGLRPQTPYDMEKMASLPMGSEYEISPLSKRSTRQMNTYWKALGLVVKVDGRWPTDENLHRDIKITLGYTEKAVDLRTNSVLLVPDSIALDKMKPEEFNKYMTQAMALLADTVGFDPLAFLDQENAA